MKAIFNRLFNRIRGYFPSLLPTGTEAFHKWSDKLIETYPMPTEDKDSLKFALATTIMHLGPQDHHKANEYFYRTIVAGASKQVAHSVFTDIKLSQKAAAEKLAAEELAAKNVISIQQS